MGVSEHLKDSWVLVRAVPKYNFFCHYWSQNGAMARIADNLIWARCVLGETCPNGFPCCFPIVIRIVELLKNDIQKRPQISFEIEFGIQN